MVFGKFTKSNWKINHFAETTSTIINSVTKESDGNYVLAFNNIIIRGNFTNKKIDIILNPICLLVVGHKKIKEIIDKIKEIIQ